MTVDPSSLSSGRDGEQNMSPTVPVSVEILFAGDISFVSTRVRQPLLSLGNTSRPFFFFLFLTIRRAGEMAQCPPGEPTAGTHSVETWSHEVKPRSWRNVAYWFTLPGLLSLLFFYNPELSPPRDGIAHSKLGPPTSILNQRCNPIGLPTGQSYGGVFSVRCPLPRCL